MKITIREIDRRAALLAGYEVGQTASIEATPADFGDAWPDVLAALDLKHDGSATCLAYNVAAPTIEAVIAAVAADKTRFAARWAEVEAEIEAAIEKMTSADPITVTWTIHEPGTSTSLGTLPLMQAPHASRPSIYDSRVPLARRADPIWKRLEAAFHDRNVLIDAANKATTEAALPRLREEKAARDKEEAEAAAVKAAEREAALAKLGAERLASGHWERGTSGYNSRRQGKPWCANINGIDATGKLIYAWGEWSGRVGEAGLLRLVCHPGDIIAWGQKDLRRFDKSEHHIQRMRDDGLMEAISTIDAVRAIRARAKA